MLVEKEIIAPGDYWYTDEKTGLPRKLHVTPELTKYWHEMGSKMLSAGLTVPVPYEHDFAAHPMTPREKLLNNAGEVKEYRLKKDALYGVVEVQDPEAKTKIGHNIRWTSPWITSFTDGNGQQWNNVIAHLALTTRPRITKQQPFSSIAAALSMASDIQIVPSATTTVLPPEGIVLSRAGRLGLLKKSRRLAPRYPIAFSMFSGAALGEFPPKKEGNYGPPDDDDDGDDDDFEDDGGDIPSGEEAPESPEATKSGDIDLEPYGDPKGDVKMEELLCDLLSALGVHCEYNGDEAGFKRSLYTAAMAKIHELTGKAQNQDELKPGQIGKQTQQAGKPTGAPGATNPLIQQEQQPMYMSLEEINKISDPTMRAVALSMYTENERLRGELDNNAKRTASLEAIKLKDANDARATKIAMLGRLSPRAKADLEAMVASPSYALSIGEGGTVVDPMAQTLAVLEKGLADMPRLLTTDMSALSVQPQPTDGEMTEEMSDRLADDMARKMGVPPKVKAG